MKKLILILSLVAFVISANAQLITKSTTTHKTAAVNLNFTAKEAGNVFGIQVVLDSSNMHANDSILTSFQVSNDGVRYVAFPSLSGSQLKKTVPAGAYTGTINWKYFRVVLTPSSNDSTFTAYGYLFVQ
jgi:hypothetical protein